VYLQALAFSAVVALLAGAWVQMTSASVLTAAGHVAARYANIALERAQDDLAEAIAGEVAVGLRDGPFTAPPASAAVAAGPFFVATQVEIGGQTGSPAESGNVSAGSVQGNAGVAEHRVGATLFVAVSNAGGSVLARATRHVTVRTFAVWPYVALSGADEATIDGYAVADFAGSCDGSDACGGVDNRIHAVMRRADALQPERCAGSPDKPVDVFADQSWYDPNAEAKAWSP
jgi:hypothetical protein